MFREKRIEDFLVDLASSAPVPGGGSAAALTGAIGASLLSMVCNLTIGKEKYRDVDGEMREILASAESLRARLLDLLEADTQAYSGLAAAYKMPRATDEEQEARNAAVQKAVAVATDVPLQIAERCADIVTLAVPTVAKGNVRAVSDVGVAVLNAQCALKSALLNVDINLPSIKDEAFRARVLARVQGLVERTDATAAAVLAQVRQKL